MSQKIISCTTPMKPLGGVEKQRNERGSHNENLKLHAQSQDLRAAQVATLLEVDLLIGAVAVGVTLPPLDVRHPARTLHLLLQGETAQTPLSS